VAPSQHVESPVTDNYGYNQTLSRKLSVVTDLMLSCRLRVTGEGLLAVRAHDGRQQFRLQWDLARKRLSLFQAEKLVAQATCPAPLPRREMLLETVICDRQFQLALDGQCRLAYTYAQSKLPLCPRSQPLSIGAAGVTVQVARLCVWRDVYYTHPDGISADWSMAGSLEENQYFLLGDNSPISIDGRHGGPAGRIKRHDIVGRVIRFPHAGDDGRAR
jgi:hypothetical protein